MRGFSTLGFLELAAERKEGSKVTIKYKMKATSIEVKGAAKKAEKKK